MSKKIVYYYDTSILKNFGKKKNHNIFNNFIDEIEQYGLNQEEFPQIVSSSNLILELSGLGQFKDKILNCSNLETEILHIIQTCNLNNYGETTTKICNYIEDQVEHEIPKIIKFIEEEYPWIIKDYNPWAQNTLATLREHILSSASGHKAIKVNLSLEILQDINYEKILDHSELELLVGELLLKFYESMASGKDNFNAVRSSLRFLSSKSKIAGNNKIKVGQDLVDCEFIHQLIFGLRENNKTNRIRLYTCEDYATTINRTRFYFNIVQYIHNKSCELKGEQSNFLEVLTGESIHFNSQTGEIIKIINHEEYIKEANQEFEKMYHDLECLKK